MNKELVKQIESDINTMLKIEPGKRFSTRYTAIITINEALGVISVENGGTTRKMAFVRFSEREVKEVVELFKNMCCLKDDLLLTGTVKLVSDGFAAHVQDLLNQLAELLTLPGKQPAANT